MRAITHALLPTVAGMRRTICCHRANFGHGYPPNSLPAVAACVAAGVPRIEVDVRFLADGAMLIFHDDRLERTTNGWGKVSDLTHGDAKRAMYLEGGATTGLCFLGDAVDELRGSDTLLQVDLKLMRPITEPQLVALTAAVAPLREGVMVGSMATWNLRSLAARGLRVALDPTLHIHYAPERSGKGLTPSRLGTHGFWDDAPLAHIPHTSPIEYLASRVDDLVAMLPAAREWMVDTRTILQMADLGFALGIELKARSVELAAWTLHDLGPEQTRILVTRLCAAGVTTLIADDADVVSGHVAGMSS